MKIPEKWLPFVKVAAALGDRLAIARLHDHEASKARVRVKQAPRRKRDAEDKREGWEKVVDIRNAVFARAAGVCEACFVAPPTELHHVLSGPERRANESIDTCAAICWRCHRAVHRNDLGTLSNLRC